MSWVIERVNEDFPLTLASLMLVIALGFTIGRLKWRGMSIGPAGGTLALAIVCGALGLSFRSLQGSDDAQFTIGAFGFVLFIYSVGFEAGPRFFAMLRGGTGWRFVAVGTMVNVLALGVAVAMGHLFALGEGVTAGLLSGSLTSPPTYAAAVEMTDQRSALAVSFALTYPIGLVLVVLMVQFLPRLMGDDLSADESGADDDETEMQRRRGVELTRAFDVTHESVCGRPLNELDLTHTTGCYLTLIHRGSAVFAPDADTELRLGDHLLAKGRLDELHALAALVGPEVYDVELRDRMPAPRRMRVLSKTAIGQSITDLDVARRFRCMVVGVERGGEALEVTSETVLERADVLEVVGRRGDVKALAEFVGRYTRPVHQTDIAVYATGIFFGLLFGYFLAFEIFGFDFRLGFAGGLLIAGVLMGRFKYLGPFQTHVPRAARQLVRDLGILLFVAETGVKAGGSNLGEFGGMIVPTLGAALLVTFVSVLGAVWFGRKVLKLSPSDTWGSIGGGMTSSAALVSVKRAAESNAPALSYAAAYAVASVLVTMLGQVVIYFMR